LKSPRNSINKSDKKYSALQFLVGNNSPKNNLNKETPSILRNKPFFKATEHKDSDTLDHSEEFRSSKNNNLYTKDALKLKKSNFILRSSVNKEDLLMSKEHGLDFK